MSQKPMLNLGCGRVILPAPAPAHYGLLPPGLTEYALYCNVDRNAAPGVDEVLDVFCYPWPFADNAFDGALCAHLCEHIPHPIAIWKDKHNHNITQEREKIRRIAALQDGWFCFFSELYRVLTPGSLIHVLSPYAWSDGGITDPTHTRLLTPASFTHSMTPDPDAPFAYATGGLHLELTEARYNLTPEFAHLSEKPERLQHALRTQLNVAYEFYVQLKVVK